VFGKQGLIRKQIVGNRTHPFSLVARSLERFRKCVRRKGRLGEKKGGSNIGARVGCEFRAYDLLTRRKKRLIKESWGK